MANHLNAILSLVGVALAASLGVFFTLYFGYYPTVRDNVNYTSTTCTVVDTFSQSEVATGTCIVVMLAWPTGVVNGCTGVTVAGATTTTVTQCYDSAASATMFQNDVGSIALGCHISSKTCMLVAGSLTDPTPMLVMVIVFGGVGVVASALAGYQYWQHRRHR